MRSRRDRGHTDVGRRTAILQVSVALRTDMAGNTDGSSTVGDTRRESADVAGLMTTSETEVVVLAVDSDVLVVPLRELGDGLLDVLHASGLAHRLGGVVGVAPGAVPVALERLGVERDLDAPLLGDADEEVARHPEVVAHGDALAWADLELPLGGHDLGVDTRDVDTSVEAGTIVGLNQVAGENLSGTWTTQF